MSNNQKPAPKLNVRCFRCGGYEDNCSCEYEGLRGISLEERKKFEELNNDNICLDCIIRGRCCYYHTTINGQLVETDVKCDDLLDNGLCSIYFERFEKNSTCKTIEAGIDAGVLLPQCYYVRNNQDYLLRKDRRIPKERVKIKGW